VREEKRAHFDFSGRTAEQHAAFLPIRGDDGWVKGRIKALVMPAMKDTVVVNLPYGG
jgi:hypothetical protein